ncbi:hypothetical protein D1007_57189 [Hordeum vulgare]|nr:hypothetical protein D1007_57189 [Hordeum vulgare]
MGGGGRAGAREACLRVLIFLKKDSEQPEEEYPTHGKEISKFTSGAAACRQWPEGELHRDVMPGSCGYPLGISSNDGWKDENICGLTRLESVSTSSINQGSSKSSRRKASCMHGEYSMAENIIGSGPYNSEDLHQDRPRRSLVRSSTYRCYESDVQSPLIIKRATLLSSVSLDEAQSVVTEHEIHVNFEEPTYCGAMLELSETGGRLVHGGNFDHSLCGELHAPKWSYPPPDRAQAGATCTGLPFSLCGEYDLYSSHAAPEWQGEAQSSAQNMILDQEQTFAIDDHFIVPSPRYSASQTERKEHDRCEDNQAPSDHLTEKVSVVSSNEDEQPSPVSVLVSSVDAEDCCLGGFEKISGDLQGKCTKRLRMQLRLLKMEAIDDADDTDLVLFSNDETAELTNPR